MPRDSACRLPSRLAARAAPLIAALLLLCPVPPAQAAQQQVEWNSARALELLQRARARRAAPVADTLLHNYTARAEGFVYFYLDRRDTDERTLVKTDQVALELFWAAPDRTKQRIVGLRDESRLPNRMHYHLDHLTVVQNGFGDLIRMGDGDEVRDVPHPAAPGSDSIYAFRLADSLTLRLPGAAQPIRVYELNVRPYREYRPALVGSIFIDRGTADIVRMAFTFTPVSYVDRRIDHISVSRDNGLWEGRYWLPYEQSLQIRRQIPELDFAASAIIQGRMRIGDYTFNDSIPPSTFLGLGVTAVPEAERRAFAFERGLHDDLDEAGLDAAAADLDGVRRDAAELLGAARLSGLARWRLSLGSVSSAVRYNRADGLALGAGMAYVPGAPWRVDFTGGYAFGAERPWAGIAAQRSTGDNGEATFRAMLRHTRDLGLAPAIPHVINSFTAAVLGDDHLDPYHATGVGLSLRRRVVGHLVGEIGLAAERHASARLTQRTAAFNGATAFRPVRGVDDGDLGSATVALHRVPPSAGAVAWGGSIRAELGTFSDTWYVRPTVSSTARWSSVGRERQFLLEGSAGTVLGTPPSQRLFLLGGRNTLPGHPFRGFAGSRYALASAGASVAVLDPWLRLRLNAAAGAAGGLEFSGDAGDPAPGTVLRAWHGWDASGTGGLRFGVGAGAGLLWDLLHVDVVHGLNGDGWHVLISFHREFWDIS